MRILLTAVIGVQAFSTYAQNATFIPLGDLPREGVHSLANGMSANGMSANGMFVTGDSDSLLGVSAEAYRWSAVTGMVSLGDLSGGTHASVGYALTADGSVVVGTGHGPDGQEAFRWTQNDGMQPLGVLSGLPGSVVSHAKGVSGDGSVIVGVSGPTEEPGRLVVADWSQAVIGYTKTLALIGSFVVADWSQAGIGYTATA